MPNELILAINLVVLYLAVLLWYYLFGTKGLYCFSIFATIVANIEVLILIDAFGLEQTLGNVLFATTFLITDIVSEVNGKKESQKVVNTNIITSLLFIFVSQMWLLYTPSGNDFAFGHFKVLFSATPRIVIASLVVYAVSQKFDVWLYHKWWGLTSKFCKDKSKYLWLRNNGSTLVSQAVNAVLYNLIAFGGVYPWETVGSIIATSYIIYIITSIADTPIVYLARKIYHSRFADKNEDEVTNRLASVTFGIKLRKKADNDASINQNITESLSKADALHENADIATENIPQCEDNISEYSAKKWIEMKKKLKN